MAKTNPKKQISQMFGTVIQYQQRLEKLEKQQHGIVESLRNLSIMAVVLEEKGIVTNEELNKRFQEMLAERKASQGTPEQVPIQFEDAGAAAGDLGSGNTGLPQGEGSVGTPVESRDGHSEDNPSNTVAGPVAGEGTC